MSRVQIKNLNDNVYVNTLIRGNESGVNNNEPVFAAVNLNFTEPFLSDAEEYYASIIRFDIPLNEIPLFIFPVTSGGNTSRFTVGVSIAGTNFSRSLIYVNDGPSPVPVGPDPLNVYYWVYSFQNFVDSFNAALLLAFTDALSPGGVAPFLWYTSSTQLFSMYIPETFVATGAIIYVNSELQLFLDGFRWLLINREAVGGRDYDLIVPTTDLSKTYPSLVNLPTNQNTAAPSPLAYIITQDFNNMVNLVALRRIIILTNNIPIINENVGSEDASYLPIFQDFVPFLNNTTDFRGIAYYEPSGQYRIHDMKGRRALYKFDLQVFWQDPRGRLLPLLLNINETASIKTAFFKKSLYNNVALTK